MDKAKIRLSPKEAELVSNADWILTEHVLQKIKQLLLMLQSVTRLIAPLNSLMEEVLKSSPKISRGENYKGPMACFDYPRYFNKDDVFAIRTLFWWGNFSITLHLSGYKMKYETKIIDSFESLQKIFSVH
jgi:hypothetical protein